MDQSGPVVQAGIGDDTQEPAFSEEQKTVVSRPTGEADWPDVGTARRSSGSSAESACELPLTKVALRRACRPVARAGRRGRGDPAEIDHSVLGNVVQARDDLFVGRDPILLMVEPHRPGDHRLICHCGSDAETWGCVLLFTQDRRVQIQGLAEDGCIPYALSWQRSRPWMRHSERCVASLADVLQSHP